MDPETLHGDPTDGPTFKFGPPAPRHLRIMVVWLSSAEIAR